MLPIQLECLVAGNNFPVRVGMHASASYYDSFIVAGGANRDSIYRWAKLLDICLPTCIDLFSYQVPQGQWHLGVAANDPDGRQLPIPLHHDGYRWPVPLIWTRYNVFIWNTSTFRFDISELILKCTKLKWNIYCGQWCSSNHYYLLINPLVMKITIITWDQCWK